MTIKAGITIAVLAAAFGAGWAVNGWRLGAKLATAQAATAAEHAARVKADENRTAADAALARQTQATLDAKAERDAARGAADSIATQAAKDAAARDARIKELLARPLPADPAEAVREACRRRAVLLEEVPR